MMRNKTDKPAAAAPSEHDADAYNGKYREVTRLRLLFLVPLTVAILAIIAVLIYVLYHHEYKSVDENVLHIRASAQDFYESSIRYDAQALQAVMDVLEHDHVLKEALARGDRLQLLKHSSEMFERLKRDFSITHLYFTGPDRVNLLRVHAPNRYGDRIDRFTTLAAERDGATSYGVELGPLGTFTLRVVAPWHEEQTRRLIGYVELGMETDQVLQKLRELFGVEIFVLIHKDRLDRKNWEQGMHALGRSPDWDRFQNVVLGGQPHKKMPSPLVRHLADRKPGSDESLLKATSIGTSHRAVFLPLQDAGGRTVAHMALVSDVSQELDAALATVYAGSVAAMIAGGMLLGFFYFQVGRIGRRIEHDEQELEDIATHDRLTGAWNRHQFEATLAQEIRRAERHGFPLSLIMFDIDHFKQVNDRYGHQAGDDLLAILSVYVGANIRDVDMLARWGGEEFMVILPDTGIEAGSLLAEKLRELIEHGCFGEAGRITCSFGVTQFASGDTVESITGRADSAMYEAKQAGRNCVRRSLPPGWR